MTHCGSPSYEMLFIETSIDAFTVRSKLVLAAGYYIFRICKRFCKKFTNRPGNVYFNLLAVEFTEKELVQRSTATHTYFCRQAVIYFFLPCRCYFQFKEPTNKSCAPGGKRSQLRAVNHKILRGTTHDPEAKLTCPQLKRNKVTPANILFKIVYSLPFVIQVVFLI